MRAICQAYSLLPEDNAHTHSRRNKVNYLRNSSLNGNEYVAAVRMTRIACQGFFF